jgi:hypothetical protein
VPPTIGNVPIRRLCDSINRSVPIHLTVSEAQLSPDTRQVFHAGSRKARPGRSGTNSVHIGWVRGWRSLRPSGTITRGAFQGLKQGDL